MDGQLRPTTVRFGRSAYEVVRREAERDGMSLGAWIREAAIARAIYTIALRAGPAGELAHHLRDLRTELDEAGVDGALVVERVLARVAEVADARIGAGEPSPPTS